MKLALVEKKAEDVNLNFPEYLYVGLGPLVCLVHYIGWLPPQVRSGRLLKRGQFPPSEKGALPVQPSQRHRWIRIRAHAPLGNPNWDIFDVSLPSLIGE